MELLSEIVIVGVLKKRYSWVKIHSESRLMNERNAYDVSLLLDTLQIFMDVRKRKREKIATNVWRDEKSNVLKATLEASQLCFKKIFFIL